MPAAAAEAQAAAVLCCLARICWTAQAALYQGEFWWRAAVLKNQAEPMAVWWGRVQSLRTLPSRIAVHITLPARQC